MRTRTDIVRGNPIRVGEWNLVPVARVSTYTRRHVLVGSERLAGYGRGFVHMQPVAVIERH